MLWVLIFMVHLTVCSYHVAYTFQSESTLYSCLNGFESCCSHLNFRYRTCFEQGVPWHSGNYRVWIRSETCMWHDKYYCEPNSRVHKCKHVYYVINYFDLFSSCILLSCQNDACVWIQQQGKYIKIFVSFVVPLFLVPCFWK